MTTRSLVMIISCALFGAVAADTYCAGNASVAQSVLYTEPPCAIEAALAPGFSSRIEYAAVAVANLSFCCKSNYTALLPKGTDLAERDAEAQWLVASVERFLHRVDCSAVYPFHSCRPCLEAYRTWACAQLFPMRCLGSGAAAIKVCDDVCLEVQRKCPTELQFTCPLAIGTSDNGDGTYTAWRGGFDTGLFGRGGCNPGHYNLGPGSRYTSTRAAAASMQLPLLLLTVLLSVAA
jgi:hypothetical protein